MTEQNTDTDFYYKLNDLFSADLSDLRNSVKEAAGYIMRGEEMAGTLNAWIFELAANALKTTYKKIYHATMLAHLGLEELPYEEWLYLFKTELEEHSAENFSKYCKDNNIYIEIRGFRIDDIYRFEVINDGIPSQEEWERIQKFLNRAKSLHDLDFSFEENDETERGRKEGGGIGLSMIILGLRSLSFDTDSLKILVSDNKTISRLDLPLRNIKKKVESSPDILSDEEIQQTLYKFQKNNDFSILKFDVNGNLISLSRELLESLGYDPDITEHRMDFQQSIPHRLFNELIYGNRSISDTGRFDNYRIYMPIRNSEEKVLFSINGHMDEQGHLNTLWKKMLQGNKFVLSEGDFSDNLKLFSIIKPYIPSLILKKSKEILRIGQSRIPDEVIDRTVLFADLKDFTAQAEIIEHIELLGLLNLVFSVMVKSIRRSEGYIEKFMGDAVLASFPGPLNAVIAAIEIQNQFSQLNHYRAASGAQPIHLRIGINSGMVLMGNIGTLENKDITPLGDVVNTASKIEKNGTAGCVHLSQTTYERVKENVTFDRKYRLQSREKKGSIQVYSVNSVRFYLDEHKVTLKLRTQFHRGPGKHTVNG